MGPVQGVSPPPKQCADVKAKVGEMIDAPHPNHSSESPVLVGKANIACKGEDGPTTVPLMIFIDVAAVNTSLVVRTATHVMPMRLNFILTKAFD